MAGSFCKVQVCGRVGKGPEVRNTQTGTKIVNLTIATSERWKDKTSGEQKERTEWHRIVIFNERVANFTEQYIRKGWSVWVEGTLRTRKWQNQSGQDQYTTEIVIENFKGDLIDMTPRIEADAIRARGDGGDGGQQQGYSQGNQQRQQNQGGGQRSGQNGSADPRYGNPAGNRQAGSGGPSWDAPNGGDLDDEIPF